MKTRQQLLYEGIELFKTLPEEQTHTPLGVYALKCLEKLYLDSERWIKYWIIDLRCGEGWYPGCLVETSGEEIPLKTQEDLYNLLEKKLIYKSRMQLQELDRPEIERQYLKDSEEQVKEILNDNI